MSRPPALLFDLDGTLVDSAQGIAAALTVQLQRRGGGSVPTERVRCLVSHGVETLVRQALGNWFHDPIKDISEFRTILAELPVDPASIYSGVIEALEQLVATGHPMAVVTNKPERLSRQLLHQLNLARFFQAVVGGDTLPVSKPDPAPLHHALQLLAHSEAAVMIGDSDIDAEAAMAAGIQFTLFEGGYGPMNPDGMPVKSRFNVFSRLPEAIHEHSKMIQNVDFL